MLTSAQPGAVGPRRQASCRRTPSRVSPAFNLVELVVTVGIIAILSAIAIGRYGDFAVRYRGEAAARRVAADLRLARSRAMTSSTNQSVIFDVEANRYSLPGVADLNRPSEAYTTDLSQEPYAAKLVSAAFGESPQVSFNGFGLPDSGGAVTVRAGSVEKTVTVDGQTGEVSAP